MCVSEFAAERNVRKEHIYDLGDGIIAIVVVESDDGKMIPRTGSVFSDVASPKKSHNYNLVASDGDFCDVRVWNDASKSSGIEMDVTFKITISGETTTLPTETVEPGNRAYTQITDTKGNGLSGRVYTTIKAVDADSVPYTYIIDQSWR